MSFEVNKGQTDGQVKFLSHGAGYTVFLTASETVLSLGKLFPGKNPFGVGSMPRRAAIRTDTGGVTMLRVKLVGANVGAQVSGVEELPGKTNYFVGNDPKKWLTDVPTFSKVKYQDVYPGVDLIYYGNQGQLECDFVVAPGANPRAIKISLKGAGRPRLDADGDLVLDSGGAQIRLRSPFVYQEEEGTRKVIRATYVLKHDRQVGFLVPTYDSTKPLVIDPVLSYASYLGGMSVEQGNAIAVHPGGEAYVTGFTTSSDFPTANAIQETLTGFDMFVTKVNVRGTGIVYSTYLGGLGGSFGNSIAVDVLSNVYITGSTNSTNFPTASPVQAVYGGGASDAFVTKLNAAGNALVYSTYLGGSGSDIGLGIALDSFGSVYVTGNTASTNFPTVGPFQGTYGGGGSDAFVTKLNAAGSVILYSTYLGGRGAEDFSGPNNEEGRGIAVDASGNAYVTGLTDSTNFPTASPFQATYGGGVSDTFVTKLNVTGDGLVYSTYLGGGRADMGLGIAVDAFGNAHVTGNTASSDFPTANSLQATRRGAINAFVTKLNAAGSALIYSTYLGGSGSDTGNAITLDPAGNAYVTGRTESADDFPTAKPLQSTFGGGSSDAFVTKMNLLGSALVYSTYLGGRGLDAGNGIATDSSGNAYVTGRTESTNFPTAVPFQATNGGVADAFVARIVDDNLPNLTIVPHFVIGGGFVTRLFIRNLATVNNNLSLQFLNRDGTVLRTELQQTFTAGQTIARSSGEASRSAPLTTQQIVIGSNGPISASALFDCCASGGEVSSAVGVLAQTPGRAFTAPFIFQREVAPSQALLVEGVGIGNVSERANTVTIRLLDQSGNQMATDTLDPIPGSSQTAFVVSDLPNIRAQLEGRNTFLGSLVISGTQPFAPVIVGNLGGRLFSLPITTVASGTGVQSSEMTYIGKDTYLSSGIPPGIPPARSSNSLPAQALGLDGAQVVPTSPNVSIIPHFVTGGGFVTRIFVINLASTDNSVVVSFINQGGTLARTERVNLAPRQVAERSSGEASRSMPQIVQWIALGSDGPISASALFDCCATGTAVTSAVGVLAQSVGASFTAPFIFQRENASQPLLVEGLGIANRSESEARVTIRLLDQAGSELSADTLDPIQGFGQTAFIVSDLPNVRSQLEGRSTFLGSLVISGTQPFAPVIVGNLGGRLFSLPLTPQ